MYLAPNLGIVSTLLGYSSNDGEEQAKLFGVPLVDVGANGLQDFVFALKDVVLVVFPILFEVRTSLLIYFLLYIKVSFVED